MSNMNRSRLFIIVAVVVAVFAYSAFVHCSTDTQNSPADDDQSGCSTIVSAQEFGERALLRYLAHASLVDTLIVAAYIGIFLWLSAIDFGTEFAIFSGIGFVVRVSSPSEGTELIFIVLTLFGFVIAAWRHRRRNHGPPPCRYV
jgi:hypothetical protein